MCFHFLTSNSPIVLSIGLYSELFWPSKCPPASSKGHIFLSLVLHDGRHCHQSIVESFQSFSSSCSSIFLLWLIEVQSFSFQRVKQILVIEVIFHLKSPYYIVGGDELNHSSQWFLYWHLALQSINRKIKVEFNKKEFTNTSWMVKNVGFDSYRVNIQILKNLRQNYIFKTSRLNCNFQKL